MSIRFQCSNDACAKRFIVDDKAAGRAGKCPVCGTAFRVPELPPAAVPVDLAPQYEVVPESRPTPPPRPKPKLPEPIDDVWEEDLAVPSAPAGPAVSFGAIGLGWQLLKAEFGTWVLTTLLTYVVLVGMGIVMQMLTIALAAGVHYLLGPAGVPLVMLMVFPVNLGVQGYLFGGLIRMALKQLDGGDIAVGDLFSLGRTGEILQLALAMIVVTVLGAICSVFLIVPGLIFAALSMFTLHLIVDGGLGVGAALASSVHTLRRSWLKGMLFLLAIVFLSISGMLLLGLGVLITMPWAILSLASQYRRSFATGAKPRAAVVEDPHAEALGVPAFERTVPRAPVGALWVLMTFGVVAPVAMFAFMIAVAVQVMEKARARNPNAVRVATKGANRPVENFADTSPASPLPVSNRNPLPRSQVEQPSAATALAGLRGDSTAQVHACNWLAAHSPGANDPLQSQIGEALEELLKQPEQAYWAARALHRWATTDNLPALAEAARSGNVQVSTLAKLTLAKLQNGTKPEAGKAIAGSVEQGRNGSGTDNIQLTLTQAKDGDTSTRINALQSLRKGPPDLKYQDAVIEAMIPLLTDSNSVIRANAVGAIGVWARPGDYNTLLDVAENETGFVRTTAFEALANIKDPEIISKVVALAVKPELSNEVKAAVRKYGSDAEPALLSLLESDSPQARSFACQMLRTVGTEKCLPALRIARDDPDSHVKAFARSAVQILERKFGVPSTKQPAMPRQKRTRTPRSKGTAPSSAQKSPAQRDADPESRS